VQSPPFLGGEHAGQELQVQVPMRVIGPRGEVADRGRLQHLDRHLNLPAARADAGDRVLREPGDDLLGRAILRGAVRRGDVRVQRGRE